MVPKIYLFGDSITEQSFQNGYWGAALANHFVGKADVVVRGFSGYNTRWALKEIDRVFPEAEHGGDPLAVTVFFGANDACLPDRYAFFQHVPLPEYKQNLTAIFAFIKKRWPSTLVVFITPPPIDEEARILKPYVDNPSGLPERTNEAAGLYAEQCLAAAAECGAPAIDIWKKMQENPSWEKEFLNDGLHLSEKGNKIVLDSVIEKLGEANINIDTLKPQLPTFDDIMEFVFFRWIESQLVFPLGSQEGKCDVISLKCLLRSSALFWPPPIVVALKNLAKGPDASNVHSGELFAVAIASMRDSLGLPDLHSSASLGFSLFFDEVS
ncbi:hypothetical protein M569_04424 [Genlisea aurea]|uniref:SGNH hydrolase-type esterase domain-containing protein n=1 Tax=Genlisea aurea TaxID=192259 RepID=S8CZ79_9LAMI|nr:hypothetical protein M569_04424 [Genlisea aurea]